MVDANKINKSVDSAFDDAFKAWDEAMHRDLYPAAFANEYSWLRVKSSLSNNNAFLKEALKSSLKKILIED